jgi:hypothetical protein
MSGCAAIGQDLLTLEVIHSSDDYFTEETLLLPHHLMTDTGSTNT